MNNIAPPDMRNLVKVKLSSYSLRYEDTVQVPSVRTTTYGQKSFQIGSARVWNGLPDNPRKASNFKEFEKLIHTWTGPSCVNVLAHDLPYECLV